MIEFGFKIIWQCIKESHGYFLEYFSTASAWEKGFFVFIIGIITFFLYAIIYRGKLFETGTVKYDSGYPGFDDSAEGVIVVENDKIIFKELSGSKARIFFSIPLGQITDVSTNSKLMTPFSYWFLGAYAILSERQYLTITFHQEGKYYIIWFSTHSKSIINRKLKEEILQAKNNLLKQ